MKIYDQTRPHPAFPSANFQRLVFFDNGYGASIVWGSVFNPGYELAVLRGKPEEYELAYDTDITDDVLPHLDEEELAEILKDIENLEDHHA